MIDKAADDKGRGDMGYSRNADSDGGIVKSRRSLDSASIIAMSRRPPRDPFRANP